MNAAQHLWKEYCSAWLIYKTQPNLENCRKAMGAFEAFKASFLGSRRVH